MFRIVPTIAKSRTVNGAGGSEEATGTILRLGRNAV